MNNPAPSSASNSHNFHPSILRAYDIRGVMEETLSAEDAWNIGAAFATSVINKSNVTQPKIGLAYDGRLSSPELKSALAEGMASTGAHVIDFGCGPTPMLYFSVYKNNLDAGIMVTGSHNPPTHNGFKMMIGKKSFFGEDITELGQIAANGAYKTGEGSISKASIFDEYVSEISNAIKAGGKDLKVIWDPGNGAAGDVVTNIVQNLAGEHIVLNGEIDGTFPNHHPDPTEPENLVQLIDALKEHDADIGVAFDGDGDRLGAVDKNGRILWGDQMMIFFAEELLKKAPGSTIIADVKASQSLFDAIANMGGEPVMWKTGHSLIKSKMAETGAKIAGEMSGHLFFADEYYGFDDGIYAALRLINLVSHAELSLEEMVDALPSPINTPEIRIETTDEKKFTAVAEIKDRLSKTDADVNDVDGVRVKTDDGWWLARASNTQPAIIVRCEALNEQALESLKSAVKEQLVLSGIEIPVALN